MSEQMIHLDNCDCQRCVDWFALMLGGQITGRHTCKHPIDRHSLDAKGRILVCPGGVVA